MKITILLLLYLNIIYRFVSQSERKKNKEINLGYDDYHNNNNKK